MEKSKFDTLVPAGRLLIVDDEHTILFALREFFVGSGYEVDCATSLADALRLVESVQYAVLIADLHLSTARQGEGLVLLEHAQRRQRQMRTIALAAFSGRQLEQDARSLGVELLYKPLDLVVLGEAVQRLTQSLH